MEETSEGVLYLVMDYVKKGAILSQRYWVQENINVLKGGLPRTITSEKARKYFRQLVEVVYYLHQGMGIVHKDIKPANMLVGENDELKLADFGVSEIICKSGMIKKKAGTNYFLPPEVFTEDRVKAKGIDIWAMGVTLFYLVHGETPFKEPDFRHKLLRFE